MVGKEAVVLGCQNSTNQRLRQVLIPHQPPLGAGLVKKRGDDLRLQQVIVKCSLAISGGDGSDLPVAELDCGGTLLGGTVRKERVAARVDLDLVPGDPVGAESAAAALRIECLAQSPCKLFGCRLLSHGDFGRSSKHQGGIVENLAGQALVNQIGKVGIGVDEETGCGKDQQETAGQYGLLPERQATQQR